MLDAVISWLVLFTEVFVPIFVAMSPLTVLPIFIAMTDGLEVSQSRQLGRHAVFTGFFIAVAIVLLGQALFRFLSITVDDLRVAGGVILLLIAIHDLIYTREKRKEVDLGDDPGVVPLGTPLIVGPATLAACVVLADTHGRILVIIALSLNLAFIWFLLHYAKAITRHVRPAISRAFGKVMSLFMAAIAVAMLRVGIGAFIR